MDYTYYVLAAYLVCFTSLAVLFVQSFKVLRKVKQDLSELE